MSETTSETTSENVSLDERPMEIPPAFEAFVGKLRSDKKKLMKDKAFGQSAEQLRGFIGTFTYPRFTEMVRLFASGVFEAYSLAASNAESIRRLHAFVVEELEQIRNELDDIDDDRRGLNPAVLDEFQQAFYTLGSVLKEKLSGDEEAESAYNRCMELLAEIVGDLVDDQRDDDVDDVDDDDEDEDEDEESPSIEEPVVEKPVVEKPSSDAEKEE